MKHDTVYRAFSFLNIEKKVEDEKELTIEGIASTPTPDRMGDIVEPKGAKFKLPMPLLWQHMHSMPVGRVNFAKATKDGIPFKASIPFLDTPGRLKDRLDEARQSVSLGLVSAVSIGFRAVAGQVEQLRSGGLLFKEWEWLELSLVTIPANSEATIDVVRSIDDELLAASGRRKFYPVSLIKTPGAPGATPAAKRGSVKIIPR